MKKIIIGLMLCLPFITKAQPGIRFQNELTWEQIKSKAKTEDKYILVDFVATWCVPCKKMDKEVYPNDTVGNFVNSKFISVKVQIDTSKGDDAAVQKWYAESATLMKDYKVTAVPTYLFFSPEGKPVHRAAGTFNVANFIKLAEDATDPRQQYYSLLEAYMQGRKDFQVMPYLAKMAQQLNEKDLSVSIGVDYINNYLLKADSLTLFNKSNLQFIGSFIEYTNEDVFNLYYHHGNTIDSVMQRKDFSQSVTDYLIKKDVIDPSVLDATNNNTKPEWGKLNRIIKNKYGNACAERIVTDAEISWYRKKKEWPLYTKLLIKRVEKIGAYGFGVLDYDLNNHAWQVFLHSNNKRELETALDWSNKAISINPKYDNSYDTNASILYKLGRREEALVMEDKAIALAPNRTEYAKTKTQMKNGDYNPEN